MANIHIERKVELGGIIYTQSDLDSYEELLERACAMSERKFMVVDECVRILASTKQRILFESIQDYNAKVEGIE